MDLTPLFLGAIGAAAFAPLSWVVLRILVGPMQTRKVICEACDDEDFSDQLSRSLLAEKLAAKSGSFVEKVVSEKVVELKPPDPEALRSQFVDLAGQLQKGLNEGLAQVPAAIADMLKKSPLENFGMSPQDAQSKGAQVRKANRIASNIEAGMIASMPEVKVMLKFLDWMNLGDLADELRADPDILPFLIPKLERNPWVAQKWKQYQGIIEGQAPRASGGAAGWGLPER